MLFSTIMSLAIYIQTPEVVTVDSPHHLGDQAFFTYETGKSLIAYSGNQISYSFEGQSLESLDLDNPSIALDRGDAGAVDECGRWLMGVENFDDRIIGYYHAEQNCRYEANNWRTHMRIMTAESFDGGLTFTPENKVVAELPQSEYGDYIYGRGNLSSYKDVGEGVTLTFSEYSDGGVNQVETQIAKSDASYDDFTLWDGANYAADAKQNHTYFTDKVATSIGFFRNTKIGVAAYRAEGVRITSFDDNEPTVLGNLIPSEIDWNDRSTDDLIAYPSIVGLDGSRWFGNSFWLYYTYAYRNENLGRKRILRNKVRIKESISDSIKTELASYKPANFDDTWSTTKLPSAGYVKGSTLGYIHTNNAYGRHPLYEYYAVSLQSHFLTTSKSSEFGNYVRQSGYISVYSNDSDQVALVRRYNPDTRNHYMITESTFSGEGVLLGWIEAP